MSYVIKSLKPFSLASLSILALAIVTISRAQEPSPVVRTPQQRLYVVGRDLEVPLTAVLPAKCEGASVTFAFYSRGGAAPVNSVAYPGATATAVTRSGAVSGAIRLVAETFTGTDSVWPGISSDCLDRPIVSTGPSLLIGQLAKDAQLSEFVIPRSSLLMGRETQQIHAVLSVTVDGLYCATVALASGAAKDSAGNVTFSLGGATQPQACRLPGALVQLFYPNGDVLFETRRVEPGTVQPFANLAPAAGPSTSGPLPPAAGTSPSRDSTRPVDGVSRWVAMVGLLAAGAVPVVLSRRRRVLRG
jgi:hypothetical protein